MAQILISEKSCEQAERLYSFRRVLLWVGMIVAIGPFLAYSQEKAAPSTPVRKDSHGRKFVNKIPYDVFFDRPLDLMPKSGKAPQKPLTEPENGGSKPSSDAKGNDEEKSSPNREVPLPTEDSDAPTGAVQWVDLLPIEELQGEVKSIRNRLTNSLKTQGQYRQNFKAIAMDGFEIAALGAIASQHRQAATWKINSQYVREFGTQIGQSAAGMSKDNFEKTKSAFQRLSSVLDGSIPPDSGEVPSTRPFHEAASRKELMKRIERARDWLQKDVNSEAKLKTLSDGVQREASILAALATVVTTPGYEYTENDDYQSFARQLIEGAKEAAESGRDNAFDKFKRAVEKINKSCTDCHGAYGNG